jgi:translation initiation factor IF-1
VTALARDDLINVEGTVEEIRAGGNFAVKTDMGPIVIAKLSGRMRRYHIRVVAGDRVTVGISPYDPTKGLITYRAK